MNALQPVKPVAAEDISKAVIETQANSKLHCSKRPINAVINELL